jgi:hypothetical protein
MGQVNIVGVVISQLDKLKVAKGIGSMLENVNFSIKASTVRQFLTSSGFLQRSLNEQKRNRTACGNCTESGTDGDVSAVNIIIV